MFSTLLTSIQSALGSIVSKNFVLAALFSTILAVVVNGALFQATGVPVLARVNKDVDAKGAGLIVLGVVALAYMLSSLNTFLIESLEGRHLPAVLRTLLYSGQYRELDKLNKDIREATEQVKQLALAANPPAAAKLGPSWKQRLDSASIEGQRTANCNYPARAKNAPKGHVYHRIRGLETRRAYGEPIRKDALEATIRDLEPLLRVNNENHQSDSGKALKADREQLVRLVAYARDRYKYELLRLQNDKQFTYPGQIRESEGRSSTNILAPSLFGNVGRTMRSYSLTRYGIDLDLFLTRLLRSMQNASGGSDKFYSVVQDAKTQVDFFVAMVFVAALTTIGWTAGLLYDHRHPWLFLGVAAGGPAATCVLYLLACQSYRVFADLIRTSVDTYRFQLLGDLRVASPAGSREEQAVWEILAGRTGYDSGADLTYTAK